MEKQELKENIDSKQEKKAKGRHVAKPIEEQVDTKTKKTDVKEKEKKEKGKDKPKRKKWDKKKKIKVALIVIGVIILILGIVFGVYIYKAGGNIADAALNMAADVLGEKDPIFILVLGVSEDISAPLTDTIILTGYNPDSQKAFMLSIPRDTFVGKNEATAGGYDKINALYQTSPEKTLEAVEKITGIDIDHYVVVKNTALPAIVSAIGEVDFDVPIDMDYDDPTQDLHIHLKAGMQKIDGDKAEQLLRFRHNNDGSSYPYTYGDNDYGRMRTQREFIKVVASQLVSWNNVSKLKEIGTAIFNNIETDMSLSKALGYVPYALKLNVDSIRMEQLPGSSAMLNSLSFFKHNSSETYDLINELLTDLSLEDSEYKDNYTPTKKTNTPTTTTNKENTTVENKTQSTTTVNENATEHTHNYVSEVTKPASCKETGVMTYRCTICGSTYTDTIAKTQHNDRITETVSGNQKITTKTCTVCGDVRTETTTIQTQEQDKPTNPPQEQTKPDPTPPKEENTTPPNPVETDPGAGGDSGEDLENPGTTGDGSGEQTPQPSAPVPDTPSE